MICQMQDLNTERSDHRPFISSTKKVADNDPTVIDQPSTKTKSSNLKGSEINIGDSIIIPRDMRIDAITISITRNGKKIRNLSQKLF